VRGFGLGTAGLVIAVSSAAQLTAGLLAGPVIDRVGPRLTLGKRARPPGARVRACCPSSATPGRHSRCSRSKARLGGVLAESVDPDRPPDTRRPAARGVRAAARDDEPGDRARRRRRRFIAHISSPGTFTTLFVLDAVTFLGYVVVLAFVHDPGVTAASDKPASYAAVFRHKTFLGSGG